MLLAYLIPCSFLLGACSQPTNTSEVPSFSGPWAVEFSQAYEAASNPAAKEALSDSVLTDMEVSEVRGEQVSCLENLGCTVYELNTDGSASIIPPQTQGQTVEEITQKTNQLSTQCDTQTNWSVIAYLYTVTHMNPDNEDTYSLMAECLVRVGIEPEGYTSDQYRSDFENGTFIPYFENQETSEGQAFFRCNQDPVNAR